MLKISSRVRESAKKRLAKRMLKERMNSWSKFYYGQKQKGKNNIYLYMDGYMGYITSEDMGIEKLEDENKSIQEERINDISSQKEKVDVDYKEICEFVKTSKNKKEKWAYIYPLKSNKNIVWVDARKLKILIELAQNNEIYILKDNMPVFINLYENDNKGFICPVK